MDIKAKTHILNFNYDLDFTNFIEDLKYPEEMKNKIKNLIQNNNFKLYLTELIKNEVLKEIYRDK